jgi:uncharacterized protein DUF2798
MSERAGTSNSSRQVMFRFRKLPPAYGRIVLPLLLSVLMTCVVSMISTLRNTGFAPRFLYIWLGAWGLSWAVAFPMLLLVLPWVRKVTAALVDAD